MRSLRFPIYSNKNRRQILLTSSFILNPQPPMLLMMSQGILKFLFAHNINISVKLHATALCRIRLVICHRALIRSDSSCYYQTRSTFTTRPHSTTSVQLAPRHRRPVCLSEAVVLTEVVIICIVIYAACRNYIFERVIIVVNSPVID